MKNKNKKLMIVVSSLLVVIGVSFAYFAASNFIGGSGSNANFTTATIQGSELRVDGNLEFNDLDIYPGHESISSIKVTATGDNELIPYNVIWEGTNTLNTSLNYTIYKTSSEIDVSASCEQQRGVIDGAMMYYEECEVSNIDSLGTAVSSGTINSNETKVTLVEDEFITSSLTGDVKYYYVILEYPNLEENQNGDIGGTFTGRVTVELSDAEPDINIIAAYIKQEDGTYEEVNDIPQEGYILNTEKSVCSNGASVRWENSELIASNLTKSGTSCYLYFDEYVSTIGEIILANFSTQLTRNDFSMPVTSTTTGTIYYEDTDKGRTYYFAGNPTDNWVQFGGFYWRIIRINEDGSIRMVYQGTVANTTGTGTQIEISAFNSLYNDNMYVGYMYTSGNAHGLGSSSTIKGILDMWYQNNLLGYADSIDGNAGFCGDRSSTTDSNGAPNNTGGTGATITYYGARYRLNIYRSPSFDCAYESDLYTTAGSSYGNQALTYPIGLISVDEVAYAGGVYDKNNSSYYLYTGQNYWTMSPAFLLGDGFYMFRVWSDGHFGGYLGYSEFGVRPVINLKSSLQVAGSGTTTDPYVVI